MYKKGGLVAAAHEGPTARALPRPADGTRGGTATMCCHLQAMKSPGPARRPSVAPGPEPDSASRFRPSQLLIGDSDSRLPPPSPARFPRFPRAEKQGTGIRFPGPRRRAFTDKAPGRIGKRDFPDSTFRFRGNFPQARDSRRIGNRGFPPRFDQGEWELGISGSSRASGIRLSDTGAQHTACAGAAGPLLNSGSCALAQSERGNMAT